MQMNDKQKLAAYGEFDKNVLVSAGAGSGKTQVLTTRVTNIISKGVKPTELLVLTFTNDAAAEMKARIRKMLSKRDDLKEFVPMLEQAYITTFDSFNLSVCRKYFYALNISPDITICDNDALTTKKREILNGILDEMMDENHNGLRDYLSKYTTKNDKALIEDLLGIIQSLDKMDDSVQYLKEYDNQFFSDAFYEKLSNDYLTFLKKITGEYTEKLKNLMPEAQNIDTITALDDIIDCASNVYSYDDILTLINIPIPTKKRGELGDSEDYSDKRKEAKVVLDKLTSYCEYKSLDEIVPLYQTIKPHVDLFRNILLMYYNRIERFMNDYGLYSFNDVQKLAIKLLKSNPDIRSEMKKSFKEILIDEYQDTSDLQESFISLFSNNNLFMVGDIKQSIYRFRNANPILFKSKYETYLPIELSMYDAKFASSNHAPGYLIDMNQNFRSRKEVLTDINRIFSILMTDSVGDANYAISHNMEYGLTKYDEQDCTEKNGFSSDFILYPYDKTKKIDRAYYEAYIIAKDIINKCGSYMVYSKSLNGFKKATYDDFCILLDRQKSFEIMKQVLEYYHIPVVIKADISINGSYISQVIINVMKLVGISYLEKKGMLTKELETQYFHALTSVLRSFLFEYSDDRIYSIIYNRNKDSEASRLAYELSSNVDKMDNSLLYTIALDSFGFYETVTKMGNVNESLHEAEFLHNKIKDLTNMGYHFVESADYLATIISDSETKYSLDNSTASGVRMMNIHKSKGLEFPICYFGDFNHSYNKSQTKPHIGFDNEYGIYIPYYIDGTIKDSVNKELFIEKWSTQTKSERVRLFYVALTRAREKMIFIRDSENVADAIDSSEHNSFGQFFDLLHGYDKEFFVNEKYLDISYFDELFDNKYDEQGSTIRLPSNKRTIYEDLKLENAYKEESHISKRVNSIMSEGTKMIIEAGLLYHEALEMLDLSNPYASLEMLDTSDDVKNVIKGVLDTDVMKNISQAKALREHEFSCIINGVSYHGIIDLLAIYDDHIDVIDYKLKNYNDEAYDRQLGIYRDYVKSKYDKEVNCYLLSIVNASFRKVD